MNKRALRIIYVTLFCAMLAAVQGIGILPGTSEVSAAPSDYRSPFDLAYSPDGTMIAVSDSTKSLLYIITASTGAIARTVTLSGTPKGLAWSGNTRVYVAEYGAGTVAEVDPSNGSVLRRFNTGRKPVGVAVLTGQSKLAVTDFGLKQVSIIDLTGGTILGNVTVSEYPYFVESTINGLYAIVGHSFPTGQANAVDYAATVAFVDVNNRTVVANLKLPHGSSNVREIKCSPNGQWAYVLHTLGRTNLPTTQVTKGWVNTNALTIIDVAQRTIYTTVLLDRMMEGAADPWGLDISSDNNTLWISVAGAHQVLKLNLNELHQLLAGSVTLSTPNVLNRSKSAYSKPYSDIWLQIRVDSSKRSLLKNDLGALWGARLLTKIKLPGQGPRGIDLAPDGTKVATGAYYAGSVYMVDVAQSKVTQTISLGSQSAEDAARRGERIWNDGTTTTQKWLSCTTCHAEGRSDCLNWDMPNDGIGTPKSSKSMLGAFDTPPQMARGIRPDAITAITAGFKYIKFKQPTQQELDDVSAYIQAMAAEQDPFSNTGWTLTTDAQAGKTLFESSGTQCYNCHNGTWFTDMKIYNVGTKDVYDVDGNYDTPTLVELWKTAPYLHDGSAPTLRDVLTTNNPSNQHGTTTQLTSTQIDQLVAYLLQLKPGSSGTSTPGPSPTPSSTPTPTATPTPTPSPIITFTPAPVIAKTGWSVHYYDSQETAGENAPATNAIDGNTATFWHTQWQGTSPPHPHEIQINLGANYNINGFKYTPRSGATLNGTIRDFEFYVSADGTNWGTACTAGSFAPDGTVKTQTFATKTGRYIRLRALSEIAGNPWTSAAEIDAYGTSGGATATPTPTPTATPSPTPGNTATPTPTPTPTPTSGGSLFTANQDIGSCSPAGSSSYNSGTYTVNGSGADIWGTVDAFHYMYKQITGDYTISARVATLQNTNAWAKGAVMIRETLANNSTYADMIVTPTSGTSFQWRATTGGSCSSTNNTSGGAAPKYLRLTRTGNTFTAFQSDNGTSWTQIGTGQTITMTSTVYVGLAVTSHVNGTLCTATFDNVSAP